MPDDTDNSAKAFQELVRVLEEAVRAGVDSIDLEYKGQDLMVFHNVGNVGLGASRIPQELQQDVIAEIVNRAGLARKSRGKMQVSLLGKDYEAVVAEYDSFGEPAYNLILKERKKGIGAMMLLERANEFSPDNQRSQPMDQAEVQALFHRFAAPLADYAATSPARKELAEMLSRNLWTALIAGPEMEEETWTVFKKQANLGNASLPPIKELHFEQMKPVVTDEQLVALRQRYRLRRQQ